MSRETSTYCCDLRDFLSDLLNFMEEQIRQAASDPADQLAAIDAAGSVVPLMNDRLSKPEGHVLLTQFMLVFENGIDREWWGKLKGMPADEFAKETAVLLRQIGCVKDLVAAS